MNVASFSFILVLFCITSNCSGNAGILQRGNRKLFDVVESDGAHSSTLLGMSPLSLSPRHLNVVNDFVNATDGTCHRIVGTEPRKIDDATSGKGIVFAIQSGEGDDDGLMISSLGFHIDPLAVDNGAVVHYEVYVLNVDGYYATPERNKDTSSIFSSDVDPSEVFDYRGNMTAWTKIAEGNITSYDLAVSSTTLDVKDGDYFRIPFEDFNSTSVPGNEGVRSFYIATKTSSFIYINPADDENVNDELIREGEGDLPENVPRILVGEGVVTYPMDDSAFMYQKKSFVGKVYFEMECPSQSPSMSAVPSVGPTIPLSDVPSFSPTFSSVPTSGPSVVASEVPSIVPSHSPSIFTDQLVDGLMLSFALDCTPGQSVSADESDAVAESVKKTVEGEAAKDPYLSEIATEIVDVSCIAPARRRHLLLSSTRLADSAMHRHLPTSSSAMDFSVVITGEYRPPRRGSAQETPRLGTIAKDSINSDPEKFVKDLQERAGQSSMLQQVEADDLRVEAVEIVEGEPPGKFTKKPTLTPTLKPTPRRPPPPSTLEEENTKQQGNSDNILLICIVVTGGIVVLLGAFLLFRHAERRAAKKRRKKLERAEEQKEKARLERRRKAEWEETNNHRHAGYNKEQREPPWYPKNSKFGDQMGNDYPLQPPPLNYYSGDAHPHSYNYGYGGQPPPPPAFGQSYGGLPPPQMQGSNYDQPPRSAARWE